MLKEYHKRFKYILVDEYQDTNTAQYMWLRLLAQRPDAGRASTSTDLRPAEGRKPDRASAGQAAPRGGQRAKLACGRER